MFLDPCFVVLGVLAGSSQGPVIVVGRIFGNSMRSPRQPKVCSQTTFWLAVSVDQENCCLACVLIVGTGINGSNADGDDTILTSDFEIGVAYSFGAINSAGLVLRDLWPDACCLLPLLTTSIYFLWF